MERSAAFGAVVLAGGSGRRLGGVDKAALPVGGRTLLERALDACAEAVATVVVGPGTSTAREVVWARERPPGGGPAAALLTGVRTLRPLAGTEWVVVLAVDMPAVTRLTVRRLLAAADAAPAADGAVLLDGGGRRQPLAAAYRAVALLAAGPGPERESGLAVRSLVGGLRLVDVPALGAEADDVDTPADLARLNEE